MPPFFEKVHIPGAFISTIQYLTHDAYHTRGKLITHNWLQLFLATSWHASHLANLMSSMKHTAVKLILTLAVNAIKDHIYYQIIQQLSAKLHPTLRELPRPKNTSLHALPYLDRILFTGALFWKLKTGHAFQPCQWCHVVLWSTQRLSTFVSTQRISRHVDITFNISTKEQWKIKCQ